ncbi:MAG TPA: ABC transporter substrate-binding protein [Gaiellaceae bacterium]|jgi:cellobiose transport system substrate-binding protein|nr:ABC transporter substrate-binding protein [Gaiellaceae bacterium]
MKTFLKTPRRRVTSLAAAVIVLGLCATAVVASTASGGSQATITLRVGLFGDFGYHDLYQKYEKTHPNIDIKEDVQSYPDHHSNLAKHLAVGSGADDIESIEVGFIANFKSQPSNFVNMNKLGVKKLKNQWLDWKWRQSVAPNGAQIGLGTDVGSLAICYRRDLFKKAGLPTSRTAVSKLWPTWQAYVATGKRFQKHAPKGVSFFDSGSNVYNAMIGQLNPAYYNAKGKVVVGSNPKVKAAYALTMKAIQAHESAGLAAFSNEWNTGYKKATFATVTCPAWMMGYIQGQAPKSKGKWDIAAVPGGGGNWGGSFLTVPKQSSHPKEAYDLAKYLTSPASETYIFKQTGNLPSQPKLLKSKAVLAFKNPFFSNAPVGKIFGTSAMKLKPQILGPHQGDIQTASTNAIQRVEQKKQSPAKSWKQFLKDVKAVA